MKVFRISNAQYIRDISGTGAKLFGGRWNSKGQSLLYTAEHRSLSALEVLVHLNKNELPNDLKLLTLEIPEDSYKIIELKNFKSIQKKRNNQRIFQEIGDKWILENESLCLKVPSVVINEEFNILLNPNHELFEKVKIENVKDFYFDKRLLE